MANWQTGTNGNGFGSFDRDYQYLGRTHVTEGIGLNDMKKPTKPPTKPYGPPTKPPKGGKGK